MTSISKVTCSSPKIAVTQKTKKMPITRAFHLKRKHDEACVGRQAREGTAKRTLSLKSHGPANSAARAGRQPPITSFARPLSFVCPALLSILPRTYRIAATTLQLMNGALWDLLQKQHSSSHDEIVSLTYQMQMKSSHCVADKTISGRFQSRHARNKALKLRVLSSLLILSCYELTLWTKACHDRAR